MYKKEQWPLTLYFDGDCPLCAREIKLLRSHASAHSTTDATQARLQLVDMSEEGFDADRKSVV